MARPQPTTAEWTILAGAAATFVGSFLDAAGGATAWGTARSPSSSSCPIYTIAVGGVVAVRRYLGADLPERVGPFTWPQLFVVVAAFGTLMAAAWLVAIDQRGVGLWVMLAGSLVMTRRDRRRCAGGAAAPLPVQPALPTEGASLFREPRDPRGGSGDDPRVVPRLLDDQRARRARRRPRPSTRGTAIASSRSRSSRCCAPPS